MKLSFQTTFFKNNSINRKPLVMLFYKEHNIFGKIKDGVEKLNMIMYLKKVFLH